MPWTRDDRWRLQNTWPKYGRTKVRRKVGSAVYAGEGQLTGIGLLQLLPISCMLDGDTCVYKSQMISKLGEDANLASWVTICYMSFMAASCWVPLSGPVKR